MVAVTKCCSRCKQVKSEDNFYKNLRSSDNLTAWCKPCRRDYAREHRKTWKRTYPEGYREKRHQEYLKAKDTRLEQTRLRKYEQYVPGLFDWLCIKQAGKCAICGTHKSELRTALCIDHNHETDKIRGLLCNRCNIGIMNLKEDAENCLLAYQYLRSN